MVICFRCSQETKNYLDNLMKTEQHKDYGDVISSAIHNLFVLEGELGEGDILVIEDEGETSENNKPIIMSASAPQQTKKIDDGRQHETEISRKSTSPNSIPTLFKLMNLIEAHLNLSKIPGDIWIPGQNVPVDRWLFGQFNRLLPAKASCRAIANLQMDSTNGISLDEGSMTIAEQAAVLGTYLNSLDERMGNSRDVAVATAFPAEGEDSIKSRIRYATQFVGSMNKAGQLSGLLIGLKLINLVSMRQKNIRLTKPGLEFALLTNPVLDNGDQVPDARFSTDEIQFLLNHISREVPAEDSAYRMILQLIGDGLMTPGDLDAALEVEVSQERSQKVSPSYLSSQRSGAISRMTDLSLIERVRDGVKVSYVLTNLGRIYMEGQPE